MVFDIQKELFEIVKDIKWNFLGILDTEKRIHAIPKNLNFQALFERLSLERFFPLLETTLYPRFVLIIMIFPFF